MNDSVPISGRVPSAVANALVLKADKLGLTLSKTVGLTLAEAIGRKENESHKCDVVNDRWKEVVGELINEFSGNLKTQRKMLDFVAEKINSL